MVAGREILEGKFFLPTKQPTIKHISHPEDQLLFNPPTRSSITNLKLTAVGKATMAYE